MAESIVADCSTASVDTNVSEAQLADIFLTTTARSLLTTIVKCPSCGVLLQARSLAYKHTCKRKVEQTEEDVERMRLAAEERAKRLFLRRATARGADEQPVERQTTLA